MARTGTGGAGRPLMRWRPDMMAQHQYGCQAVLPGPGLRPDLAGTIVPSACRRLLAARTGGVQPRRRVVLILSPAATTATACSRPGERVSRSIGPDTDVAAITFPPCPRTGADTDATPGSRSATLAAHPRRRTWASAVAVNLALRRPRC